MESLNDPDDRGVRGTDGHEIDETGGALGGFKCGFEDQGAGAIASCDAGRRILRTDEPAAGARGIEQGGETGSTVESRPAEPINRAAAADEGRSLTVADQAIFLDLGGDGQSCRCGIRHSVCPPVGSAAGVVGAPACSTCHNRSLHRTDVSAGVTRLATGAADHWRGAPRRWGIYDGRRGIIDGRWGVVDGRRVVNRRRIIERRSEAEEDSGLSRCGNCQRAEGPSAKKGGCGDGGGCEEAVHWLCRVCIAFGPGWESWEFLRRRPVEPV